MQRRKARPYLTTHAKQNIKTPQTVSSSIIMRLEKVICTLAAFLGIAFASSTETERIDQMKAFLRGKLQGIRDPNCTADVDFPNCSPWVVLQPTPTPDICKKKKAACKCEECVNDYNKCSLKAFDGFEGPLDVQSQILDHCQDTFAECGKPENADCFYYIRKDDCPVSKDISGKSRKLCASYTPFFMYYSKHNIHFCGKNCELKL